MFGGINVIIHCFNKKCKLNHQVFLAKWYAHTFRKPYNVIKFCDTAVGCSQSSPWKLQYLSFCIHRQLHVVGKKEFFKFFPLSHYPKHIFIAVESNFGELILFEFQVTHEYAVAALGAQLTLCSSNNNVYSTDYPGTYIRLVDDDNER